MSSTIDFDLLSLNKDYILSRVSELEIFQYYIKEPIKIGRPVKSVLREGDSTPSLGIYITNKGELRYKDFGYSYGNCFEFVRQYYQCSYNEALKNIVGDLILRDNTVINKSKNELKIQQSYNKFQKEIIPKKRGWNKLDYEYWSKYYISLDLITKEGGYPCKYIYLRKDINNLILWGEHQDNNPIYCWEIADKHKVYRPNAAKSSKWLQTSGDHNIQGLEYLPTRGELLLITSSMKDKWVLNTLGYNAIAPGAEGNNIPTKIMDYLLANFDNIIVFYDSDQAGYKAAEKFIKSNPGTNNIFIPEEYEVKDISDFIEYYKIDDTKRLMKRLL